MTRSLRVLHILDNVRSGVGVTQIVFDLMTDPAVKAKGVVFAGQNQDPRFAEMVGSGQVVAVSSWSAMAATLMDARKSGCRLVHVHSRKNAWAAILARVMGMQVVRTQHFGVTGNSGRRLAATLRNLMTGNTWWVSHWAAISETSCAYIKSRWHVPERRITVIPNGIDIGSFAPPSVDDRTAIRRSLGWDDAWTVFVSVGSLVLRKRHAHTIDAFAAVAAERSDVRLVIVGEGSERTNLEKQIESYALQGRVLLLGLRDDVADILRASDVCVHSAHDEAFGLVVAEAMACGLPVVACAGTGPGEIVKDGVTGLVVPPQDLEAMSEAARKLTADADTRRRLGDAARRAAESRFSVDAMLSAYRRLYSSLSTQPRAESSNYEVKN